MNDSTLAGIAVVSIIIIGICVAIKELSSNQLDIKKGGSK